MCVFAGVFLFVDGRLPEDSLCAVISLKRQISRADILGQPGGGQIFL